MNRRFSIKPSQRAPMGTLDRSRDSSIVPRSVDGRSWSIGFDAGSAERPSTPVPPGVDRLAWHLGWRRGRAMRYQP